jgi:hypothetical protein
MIRHPLADRAWWPALLLSLCACAAGNTHRYGDLVAELPYTGSGKVAVATSDQRPYVLDGSKALTFVGLSRGGFGNPFNVVTDSGKPFADELSGLIVRSLAAKGFDAIAVSAGKDEDAAAILAKARTAGAPRTVVVTVREWKSDTYINTALHYDLQLQVLAETGKVLGEAVQSGKDDLGGSAWNPPSHARTVVPRALQHKLEALFADPAVAAALR